MCQHRGMLLPDDVEERNGLQVICATRTALEVTTLTDVEHALVEVDDLLHRELTTPEKLISRYELMSHWPDTLTTGRIRYLCWTQHLPAPIPNYPIRDRHGRVIHRVDLAWPDLGLFLEFDGKVKYQRHLREGESVTDAVLREKKREDLVCELTGWRCIRLVWADLYRPEETAARIRAMFRGAAA